MPRRRGTPDSTPAIRPAAERLAPLLEQPPRKETGRIRSLAEARAALRVPASATPEAVSAWGVPPDFQLVAFAIHEPTQPTVVAEFAALLMIRREGRALKLGRGDRRPKLADATKLLWIAYGTISRTPSNILTLTSLGIGPTFDTTDTDAADTDGINSALLRLISPRQLITETAAHLARTGHLAVLNEAIGGLPLPPEQADALRQVGEGRKPRTRLSDDHLAALATQYLILLNHGHRHPLPQLAAAFGITREQARDRIRTAHKRGYL